MYTLFWVPTTKIFSSSKSVSLRTGSLVLSALHFKKTHHRRAVSVSKFSHAYDNKFTFFSTIAVWQNYFFFYCSCFRKFQLSFFSLIFLKFRYIFATSTWPVSRERLLTAMLRVYHKSNFTCMWIFSSSIAKRFLGIANGGRESHWYFKIGTSERMWIRILQGLQTCITLWHAFSTLCYNALIEHQRH